MPKIIKTLCNIQIFYTYLYIMEEFSFDISQEEINFELPSLQSDIVIDDIFMKVESSKKRNILDCSKNYCLRLL